MQEKHTYHVIPTQLTSLTSKSAGVGYGNSTVLLLVKFAVSLVKLSFIQWRPLPFETSFVIEWALSGSQTVRFSTLYLPVRAWEWLQNGETHGRSVRVGRPELICVHMFFDSKLVFSKSSEFSLLWNYHNNYNACTHMHANKRAHVHKLTVHVYTTHMYTHMHAHIASYFLGTRLMYP